MMHAWSLSRRIWYTALSRTFSYITFICMYVTKAESPIRFFLKTKVAPMQWLYVWVRKSEKYRHKGSAVGFPCLQTLGCVHDLQFGVKIEDGGLEVRGSYCHSVLWQDTSPTSTLSMCNQECVISRRPRGHMCRMAVMSQSVCPRTAVAYQAHYKSDITSDQTTVVCYKPFTYLAANLFLALANNFVNDFMTCLIVVITMRQVSVSVIT